MLFYIWFCLIWLYKAVEKTSWTFPLSAVLTVPLNQKFKGKIQLLLGFLSNPKIWVWDGDRQKFICHFILISVEFRVAHGDNIHCHRIMEYPELGGTMRIIQSSSCAGHQGSQHDVGAGVFSLVPSIPLVLCLLEFYLILQILHFSGIAPAFLAGALWFQRMETGTVWINITWWF